MAGRLEPDSPWCVICTVVFCCEGSLHPPFFSLLQLVMNSLQSILENLDTPELLCQSVKCILLVARCYPHIFSTNFRVSSTRLNASPCLNSVTRLMIDFVLLRTRWTSWWGGTSITRRNSLSLCRCRVRSVCVRGRERVSCFSLLRCVS